MHNYGLKDYEGMATGIRYRHKPFKKVELTNIKFAQNRITVEKIEKQLEKSLVLPQWERKLAIWLVEAVVKALENGEKTADITKMFSCEFITSDGEVLPQNCIQNELMYRLFVKVDEDSDVLKVRLYWNVIFL